MAKFDLLNASEKEIGREIQLQDGRRGHKFLTKELEARFAEVGSQEHVDDPTIIAKWFHPLSSWRWYAYEYDPEEKVFFGWVDGDFPELGYFSYYELATLSVRGLPIERDLYWNKKALSEIRP
jgi:hypothetical protein